MTLLYPDEKKNGKKGVHVGMDLLFDRWFFRLIKI